MMPTRVCAPRPTSYRLPSGGKIVMQAAVLLHTDDYHMREILRRFHQLRLHTCLQEMRTMRGTVDVLAATADNQTLTRIRRKTGAVEYLWALSSGGVRSRIHGRWVWFSRALTAAEWATCQRLWALTGAMRRLEIHPLSAGAAVRMSV